MSYGGVEGGYLLTADFITQAIPLKPSWTAAAGLSYHNSIQNLTPSDPIQSEEKNKKGKGERREGLNIDFSCCADQSASKGHVQNQFCLMSGHHSSQKYYIHSI